MVFYLMRTRSCYASTLMLELQLANQHFNKEDSGYALMLVSCGYWFVLAWTE